MRGGARPPASLDPLPGSTAGILWRVRASPSPAATRPAARSSGTSSTGPARRRGASTPVPGAARRVSALRLTAAVAQTSRCAATSRRAVASLRRAAGSRRPGVSWAAIRRWSAIVHVEGAAGAQPVGDPQPVVPRPDTSSQQGQRPRSIGESGSGEPARPCRVPARGHHSIASRASRANSSAAPRSFTPVQPHLRRQPSSRVNDDGRAGGARSAQVRWVDEVAAQMEHRALLQALPILWMLVTRTSAPRPSPTSAGRGGTADRRTPRRRSTRSPAACVAERRRSRTSGGTSRTKGRAGDQGRRRRRGAEDLLVRRRTADAQAPLGASHCRVDPDGVDAADQAADHGLVGVPADEQPVARSGDPRACARHSTDGELPHVVKKVWSAWTASAISSSARARTWPLRAPSRRGRRTRARRKWRNGVAEHPRRACWSAPRACLCPGGVKARRPCER